MREPDLTKQAWKALYPPMTGAFDKTVQSTLYNLTNGREQTTVRKKMSAALIFAVILVIVSLSAAIALTQSDLLGHMFGGSVRVPKGLEEIVSQPEATVTTDDVAVTLNEYLYDGEKLHLNWTVSNTAGRQIMVTMSNFTINGQYVQQEDWTSFQSDDHTSACVLGGEVDGVTMPVCINNFSTYINLQNEVSPLIRGETVCISSELYIWELLNPPVLFDYGSYTSHTDFKNVAVPPGLPVERNGAGYLTWFVADGNSSQVYMAEDYRRAYEAFGWARLAKKEQVNFTVALHPKSIRQVQPAQTTFETDDFTLVITRMAYMQTGGTLELKVYPKTPDKGPGDTSRYNRALTVLNADSMEFLSGGSSYTYGSDQDFVDYQITLEPVPGEMPQAISIVPSVAKEAFDHEAAHDAKTDRWYTYTLEDAVRVELE